MIPIVLFLALFLQQTDVRLDNGVFRIANWSAANEVNVYVDSSASDVPLSGTRQVSGSEMVFTPRYGLSAGVRYKVVITTPGRAPITRFVETPKADMTPKTGIEHVYPTVNNLPENQLKFYIHFSGSMSRGEAYQRIHLLDESGKMTAMPFLELEQELWDPDAQRFTLFFDPGRIKRDVLPNTQMGPSIVAGHKYTLVIDKEWKDAEGRQLKAGFRKEFSVGEADRKPLDVKSWKISPPAPGSSLALSVDFPEPLDHALMLRQFEVVDPSGKVVAGTGDSDRDETRWTFKPSVAWKPGEYGLRVGTIISDLAGNMIDRPFEIDVFDTVTERVARETRIIPFTIR